MFSTSIAAMLPLLLLLLLRDTLAVAPGDEYDGCEVPDYPVNIKVLMDSWRYQTLLAQNDANRDDTAVWTTDSTVSQNCRKYSIIMQSSILPLLKFSGILLVECVRTVQLKCVLESGGISG